MPLADSRNRRSNNNYAECMVVEVDRLIHGWWFDLYATLIAEILPLLLFAVSF